MYRVIDEIVGETVVCKNQYDAIAESERRLSIHQTGYSLRRAYVPPIKCHVEVREEDYIICLD